MAIVNGADFFMWFWSLRSSWWIPMGNIGSFGEIEKHPINVEEPWRAKKADAVSLPGNPNIFDELIAGTFVFTWSDAYSPIQLDAMSFNTEQWIRIQSWACASKLHFFKIEPATDVSR